MSRPLWVPDWLKDNTTPAEVAANLPGPFDGVAFPDGTAYTHADLVALEDVWP